MRPARIQLSRRAGFRLQEASLALNGLPCVKVDRTTPYGNPLCVTTEPHTDSPRFGVALIEHGIQRLISVHDTKPEATEEAIGHFKTVVVPTLDLVPLRGKNLGCWCPVVDAEGNHVPCHADVLLELANR